MAYSDIRTILEDGQSGQERPVHFFKQINTKTSRLTLEQWSHDIRLSTEISEPGKFLVTERTDIKNLTV